MSTKEQEYTFASGVVPAYVERLDYEEGGLSVIAVLQAESGPYVRLEFYDFSDMTEMSIAGASDIEFPQTIRSLGYREYDEDGIYRWMLYVEGHLWGWLSEYPVEDGAGNRAEAEMRMRDRDRRYRFKRWFGRVSRPIRKFFSR